MNDETIACLRISEDWLKEVGFRWHQIDRQPNKQWCLCLGSCLECPPDGEQDQQRWRFSSEEDFAIELCYSDPIDSPSSNRDHQFWFCWFRSDAAGRYHRFIHVRHLRWRHEVVSLVEAIGGRPWNPSNHWYGSVKCERHSAALKKEQDRLDISLRSGVRWYEAEKDDSRDRALPEHLDEAIKSGHAK